MANSSMIRDNSSSRMLTTCFNKISRIQNMSRLGCCDDSNTRMSM
uniref:Uncharacterized protein n=1 Tax=Arundo donax TaxID=35708 RepID=A0A0A9A5M9_ARUDO